MADSYIQMPADSTGKKVDTEQLTVGANTVERERIQVTGAAAAEIARVVNAQPAATDYGLVVWPNGVLSVDDNGGSLTVDGTVNIGAALPAGTNNIGDVDVVTEPATAADGATGLPGVVKVVGGYDGANVQALLVDANGAVAVQDGGGSLTVDGTVSLGAGSALVGVVGNSITNAYDGATAMPIKFAVVDVATAGDNTIVSAVAGKKIRVLNYVLVSSAANTVIWKSATTNISGGMQLAANGGISAESQFGLFETNAGEALILNLSAANSVDGHIAYVEV